MSGKRKVADNCRGELDLADQARHNGLQSEAEFVSDVIKLLFQIKTVSASIDMDVFESDTRDPSGRLSTAAKEFGSER